MSLIKINNVDMPDPTELVPTISDLDSDDGSGRNQFGTMFRDRITVKRKVSCSWGILSRLEMSTLLSAMADESFSLTYPDPQTGDMKTITAYVGDRSPAMCEKISETDWCWKDLSVAFVEM